MVVSVSVSVGLRYMTVCICYLFIFPRGVTVEDRTLKDSQTPNRPEEGLVLRANTQLPGLHPCLIVLSDWV